MEFGDNQHVRMRNKKKVHDGKVTFGCFQIAKEKLENVSEKYIIWNF